MLHDNLNDLCIHTDGQDGKPLADYSTSAGEVDVVFFGLQDKLKQLIAAHPVAVGCVAWLTHPDILQALSRIQAQIVIQKEDFLRPDTDYAHAARDWRRTLRAMYEGLSFCLTRFDLPDPVNSLSTLCDSSVQPVRCLGQTVKMDKFSKRLMHHKFLVFCDLAEQEYRLPRLLPRAVWTGSFNFTKNSCCSLENAVIIHSQTIATAYLNEWAQLLALSEPLDWESEWVKPEWRIGT